MGKIKIPKNQILWVTHIKDCIPQYVITSDMQRTKYILYRVLKDFTLEKLKTSVNPCFKEISDAK